MLNNNIYKIKVCGMRDKQNIAQLCRLNPDYLGFIFYPKSKRYVGASGLSSEILELIPDEIKKVGVFVNENFADLQNIIEESKLDAVQLHGDETVEYCKMAKQLKVSVIKAFRVDSNFNFKKTYAYKNYCDYFLFDTMTEKYGGSGEKFGWEILKNYDNEKPIFLSGGISLNDVKEILNLKNINIHALDINSKFEVEPGLKDVDSVKQFIKLIRDE